MLDKNYQEYIEKFSWGSKFDQEDFLEYMWNFNGQNWHYCAKGKTCKDNVQNHPGWKELQNQKYL